MKRGSLVNRESTKFAENPASIFHRPVRRHDVRGSQLQENVLQRTAIGGVAGGRAFLEPGLIVLSYLAVSDLGFDEPVMRPALTLCLLVFALTFPGRNRFGDHPASALIDVISSWVVLLGILLLCGYATNSLHYFEDHVLYWWARSRPCCRSSPLSSGRRIQRWRARAPGARRTAVVVGAAGLGRKRWHARCAGWRGRVPWIL